LLVHSWPTFVLLIVSYHLVCLARALGDPKSSSQVQDDPNIHFGLLTLELAVFADQNLRLRVANEVKLREYVSAVVHATQIYWNRESSGEIGELSSANDDLDCFFLPVF
jgi:hypothetical protein